MSRANYDRRMSSAGPGGRSCLRMATASPPDAGGSGEPQSAGRSVCSSVASVGTREPTGARRPTLRRYGDGRAVSAAGSVEPRPGARSLGSRPPSSSRGLCVSDDDDGRRIGGETSAGHARPDLCDFRCRPPSALGRRGGGRLARVSARRAPLAPHPLPLGLLRPPPRPPASSRPRPEPAAVARQLPPEPPSKSAGKARLGSVRLRSEPPSSPSPVSPWAQAVARHSPRALQKQTALGGLPFLPSTHSKPPLPSPYHPPPLPFQGSYLSSRVAHDGQKRHPHPLLLPVGASSHRPPSRFSCSRSRC